MDEPKTEKGKKIVQAKQRSCFVGKSSEARWRWQSNSSEWHQQDMRKTKCSFMRNILSRGSFNHNFPGSRTHILVWINFFNWVEIRGAQKIDLGGWNEMMRISTRRFFLFFFSVASEIFVQQFFRKFIPRRPFSSTLLPELCETQQHLVVHLIFKNRLQYCCSCRITFIQSHPYLMMMINNEDELRGWIRLWWSDCHAWIPCNTAVVFRLGEEKKGLRRHWCYLWHRN